jgi:TRAP-type transport system periplasmic protein
MNQGKWDKLAKADQAIIEKFSKEYVARSAGRSWDEADRKGMEAMKKSEMKIVNADAALIKDVKALSAPIEADWIQKASAKGVNAKAVLAEFRAELKKVASEK